MKRRSRLPEHPRQPIYLTVYKAAGNPGSAPSVLFPIFGFGAVTALSGCRDLLPGRLRFGFGTVRSFSIAESFRYSASEKMQASLLFSLAYSLWLRRRNGAFRVSGPFAEPSAIRGWNRSFLFHRRVFQILRLGKNASELAFSLGLFVFWLCRRYSRSAKCK